MLNEKIAKLLNTQINISGAAFRGTAAEDRHCQSPAVKAVGPSPGRALFGPGRQDPGPDAGGAEADPGGIKYHRGVRHP